uniref:Dynein axonemal assembly factor 11-like CS domain-containing protein n=1 Tax=Clastoptera arizonana TaxID=38151 RepID=A0A1B6BZ90_9HEMI
MLDSVEIQRSERIKALQNCNTLRSNMLKQQNLYKGKRLKQKAQSKNKLEELEEECSHKHDSIESQNKFWSEMSENTPEARIEIACKSRRNRTLSEDKVSVKKRVIKLFNKDGEPLNVNEARIVFNLTENDENNSFVLELVLYKFLDTQLLEVDVQPMYVKVIVKGKVFQITLREEVNTEQSTAKRSQTTGHLVITMPKVINIHEINK